MSCSFLFLRVAYQTMSSNNCFCFLSKYCGDVSVVTPFSEVSEVSEWVFSGKEAAAIFVYIGVSNSHACRERLYAMH